LLLLATITASVTFGVGVVAAHPLYEQNTSRGPYICVGTGSSIAEGPGAGGGQVFVDAWFTGWAGGSVGVCTTARNLAPGDALVSRQLWRWNGVEWRACATVGWLSSGSSTSYIQRVAQWNPMPCGNNSYYGNYGLGYGYSQGVWHSPGWVWSGYHFI
jgi:hypothetical protein